MDHSSPLCSQWASQSGITRSRERPNPSPPGQHPVSEAVLVKEHPGHYLHVVRPTRGKHAQQVQLQPQYPQMGDAHIEGSPEFRPLGSSHFCAKNQHTDARETTPVETNIPDASQRFNSVLKRMERPGCETHRHGDAPLLPQRYQESEGRQRLIQPFPPP